MTDSQILELLQQTVEKLKDYIDSNTIKNIIINGSYGMKTENNTIIFNINNKEDNQEVD